MVGQFIPSVSVSSSVPDTLSHCASVFATGYCEIYTLLYCCFGVQYSFPRSYLS